MKAVAENTTATSAINRNAISRKDNFFNREKIPPFFGGKTIQPKLTIGQPNDPYEKEADAMADKVVRRFGDNGTIQNKPIENSITPIIQTKCAACEKEEKLQKKERDLELKDQVQAKSIFESNAPPPEEPIQKKCSECERMQKKESPATASKATPSIENQLSSSKGSGSPLSEPTLGQMESSFGRDFSNVRIHNDSKAQEMSKSLNAQAFTHGNDIYFNSGKFNTENLNGQKLLAHELTHVEQQKPGKKIQRQPAGGSPAPGVNPPTPPPPGVPSKGPSKAKLVENEYKGPSIGMPPISSYDYVFKLWDNKELTKEYQTQKNWDFLNQEATLFKFPTEIGVMLNLDGSVKLGAFFEVSIGPVNLKDVRVGLSSEQLWDLAVPLGLAAYPLPNPYFIREAIKKLNKTYYGDATLDFQASIKGGFRFAAELNASADFLDMFKVAGLSAGIKASAEAQVVAAALANINLEIKKGEINFNKFFNFESDFWLQLLFNAYLKAEILGWDFDLVDIKFQKDYSKNLISLTLGTPAKISSDDGKPKSEIDIPKSIENVKKFIDLFKGNKSNILEADRKGETSSMGEIKPPGNPIPAPGNLSSYDSTLGLYLTNQRAGVGYGQFEDFMGSNVAVFKYIILEPDTKDANKPVEEKYESAPNAKGELHSEASIIGKLQKLQKGYKGGQHVFKVTHVFSERRPCTSCQSYLDQPNRLIQTKNTSVFWLVPYVRGGGKDKTSYWENIRTLIMAYGLTPPTIEAIKEKYTKPKKDTPP